MSSVHLAKAIKRSDPKRSAEAKSTTIARKAARAAKYEGASK
jgi:hypothetical protein